MESTTQASYAATQKRKQSERENMRKENQEKKTGQKTKRENAQSFG
jgi:hypothetical protein